MIRILMLMLFVSSILETNPLNAQKDESIQWLTFEALEDSLTVKPKKVFIDFYTDWCSYCKKMDKAVFTKLEVIKGLNENYYAVRFDAESEAEVNFSGKIFKNDELKHSRRPVHQIAKLLATRNGQFTAPSLIFLDEDFRILKRYFEYLDSRKLLKALE